jgi:exonuclease SbcC
MISKVELLNFISHKHNSLEFKEGVTVFIGKNGSGKSSVIDAITYALYGEHTRKSNSNLVRYNASGASVALEFTHNGKRYKVERRLNSKGNLDSAVLYEYDNNAGRWKIIAAGERKQFGESISNEISRIIGLDYSKMRIAGIIQQGEIGRIIEYKPKDFKELINSIIGIDMLDYSYVKMNDVIKGFRDRLRGEYGYDDLNIAKIEQDINENKNRLTKLSSELASCKVRLEDIKVKREMLEREYEEMKRIKEKYDKLNDQIDNLAKYLNSKRGIIAKEIEELRALIDKANKCIAIVSDEDKIKDEINRIERRIDEITDEINEVSKVYAVSEEKIKEARNMQRIIDQAKRHLRYINEHSNVHDILNEAKDKMKSIDEQISLYKEEIASIKGQLEYLKAEINSDICPICKNKISNLDKLKEELAKERADLNYKKGKLEENIKALENKKRSLEEEIARLESIAKAYDNAKAFLQAYSLLNEDISLKEREVLAALNIDIKGLRDRLLRLKEEKEDLIKRRREYDNKYNQIIEAKTFLKDNRIHSIDVINNFVNELKDKERVYKILSDDIYNKIRGDIRDLAIDDYSKDLINSILRLREESIGFSEVKFKELESRIKDIGEEEKSIAVSIASIEDKIKDVSKGIDELSRVKEMLDYARRYIDMLERIRNNVFHRDGPVAKSLRSWALKQISIMASEYAKLFDIGVSSIELKESDNAVDVICYGKRGTIDIYSMSGGEKVALVLALRFGIAYVMGGYKLDFIILDEPTVHLDEDKRSTIVELISTLASNTSLKQMIIVTHDSEIFENADVDSIYKFEMSEQGTRIVKE